MNIQTICELNHTYVEVGGSEVERTENYRYKMLSANNIKGILPLELRLINGERKIYIDVTGKESLSDYLSCRLADRDEVKRLFEAVFIITGEISKFLIGETDVMMRPDLIFKNLTTGDYEFVCIPLIEEGIPINKGMKSLLQFLMQHLDNADEELVKSVYTINDMFETGLTKFSLAYEYFTEEISEDIEELPSIDEEPKEKTFLMYFPSLKEIAAFGMCAVGLVLIGYNVYLSMIV